MPVGQPPALPPVAALLTATPSSEAFTFTYVNRPIVLFKANVLADLPWHECAAGVERALDDLVAQRITGPVGSQLFEGGALISVGSRVVLAITAPDVDDLSGETIQGVSSQTVGRLQTALEEAMEARRLNTLLRSTAIALVGLVIGVTAVWVIGRIHRALFGKFVAAAEKTVAKSRLADLEVLQGMNVADFERRMVKTTVVGLDLVVVYATLAFVLRQFPYTVAVGGVVAHVPVDDRHDVGPGHGKGRPRAVHGGADLPDHPFHDTGARAVVSRRRVRAADAPLGLSGDGCADTPARDDAVVAVRGRWRCTRTCREARLRHSKGISVFLGLMVTLGSTGLVNQIMSGFTITYSRALRVGDFVRVGEVDGTVTHLGVLSVKVRTLRNEDVTIPNAVVVSQTTTDFSRYGDTAGVFTPTSVTIGYDAPWRQVHAMLLEAAKRTSGLRGEPKPVVLQAGLEDFYVEAGYLPACLYSLLAQTRRPTKSSSSTTRAPTRRAPWRARVPGVRVIDEPAKGPGRGARDRAPRRDRRHPRLRRRRLPRAAHVARARRSAVRAATRAASRSPGRTGSTTGTWSGRALIRAYDLLVAPPTHALVHHVPRARRDSLRRQLRRAPRRAGAIGGFDRTIEFHGEDTNLGRRLTPHRPRRRCAATAGSGPRRAGIARWGSATVFGLYVRNFWSEILRHRPADRDASRREGLTCLDTNRSCSATFTSTRAWSDGRLSMREVVDLYGQTRRFDVIAITDHILMKRDLLGARRPPAVARAPRVLGDRGALRRLPRRHRRRGDGARGGCTTCSSSPAPRSRRTTSAAGRTRTSSR